MGGGWGVVGGLSANSPARPGLAGGPDSYGVFLGVVALHSIFKAGKAGAYRVHMRKLYLSSVFALWFGADLVFRIANSVGGAGGFILAVREFFPARPDSSIV